MAVGGTGATAAPARPLRRTLFFAGEAVETERGTGTVDGAMADVRGSTVEAIRDLRRDIDRQLQLIDRRFEQVDRRFEQVDQRFDQVDQRFDRVDQRFDRLERLMMWMLGVTLTGFTAVMVAVIGSISGVR